MFAKTATFAALFTVVAHVAALPPACLIAAVNTCPDPSDIKAICANPSKVTSYISKNCGDNADIALSDFESVCKDAGAKLSSSASASASATKSSGSGSGSGSHSATSTATGSPVFSDKVISATVPLVTGSSYPITFATGVAGATGSGGLGSPIAGTNGTLPTVAGTAGPTASTGLAATATGAPFSGAASLSLNAGVLAAVGIFSAMMLL